MRNQSRGFTLIELMIAVAILGILATIAYPTYLDKVRAAKRVEAKSLLLTAADREEQYYTLKHEYTDDLSQLGIPDETENDAYIISALHRKGDTQTFLIVANAIKDQLYDSCQVFTIDEIGRQVATGDSKKGDITDTCW